MSKANILSTEKIDGGKVRVVFDAASGHMTYEFSGKAAKAVLRGTDPAGLTGKNVTPKKK